MIWYMLGHIYICMIEYGTSDDDRFRGFLVSSSPSLIFITMFQKSRAQNNETTKP